MKRSCLELLCCPGCCGALTLAESDDPEMIIEGRLYCPDCDQNFFITNGICRLLDPGELAGLNRQFAGIYDWFSHIYVLFGKLAFFPFGGDRKARKEVLDRLDPHCGRLLEVSIGTGANLPYLLEQPGVNEVCGLDISIGQLRRCRKAVTEQRWPVNLFLGKAEALPFRAESFDGVLHIGGINFFSGKRRAIDEMIRVTRPGGRIVIADESERIARLITRLPGFSRELKGKQLDVSVPSDLVSDTMEEKEVHRVWKAHGEYHGYCLVFRKPSQGTRSLSS